MYENKKQNTCLSAARAGDAALCQFPVRLLRDRRRRLLLQTAVLLSTGGSGWNGFDYVINRTVAEGTASVERLGADGEADGEVGTAQLYRKGRYLAVSVPRKAVGLDKNKFSFSFKVADHVVGYTDIMNYYIQGDCAPIGRFGYTVSG